MSTEELPALPWGRPPNQAQPVDLPAQLQLKTGTARIEVFWVLEIGDEDESEDESEDVEKASKHGKVVYVIWNQTCLSFCCLAAIPTS